MGRDSVPDSSNACDGAGASCMELVVTVVVHFCKFVYNPKLYTLNIAELKGKATVKGIQSKGGRELRLHSYMHCRGGATDRSTCKCYSNRSPCKVVESLFLCVLIPVY